MGKYYRSAINVLGSALRYCVLTLVSGLLFPNCVNDGGLQHNSPDGGQAQAVLSVRMPQLSLPASVATRQQTESEMHISTLSVLIFRYDGSEYLFSYRVAGSETTPDGDYQRFRALVSSSDDPLKVIAVANAESAFESYNPPAGTPEADVRRQIELQFPGAGFSGDLPMYGEALLPNGLAAGENTILITALRAVARVDVVKDLEPGAADFILEEVHAFRVYDKVRLIPDALADPSVPRVDAPSIPGDAGFLNDPVSKVVSGGADTIQQVYIPESYAASTSGERLDGTTVIVVGGRFGGDDSPITYYRADFDPDLSGNRLGQVLRNHRYIFNIKRVNAPGWSTIPAAANNLPTSIVVEVEEWEDFSSDIYFGQNRFAISSRAIDLRFVKDREKRLDVESSLEYRIQWLDVNGDPTGDTTSQLNDTISNDNFDVMIVKDDPDPEPVTHLLFRTLGNNHSGAVISDKLRITVDNWSIDIDVRQDNTAVYSGRHFNVLSGRYDGLYPVGNLGTTATPPPVNSLTSYGGLAMRKILDVRFAPGGTIGIGGFAFEELLDNTTYLQATSDTNLGEMERILRMQNVIYLSYNVRLSNQVVTLLLAWLRENSRRVLIVGVDNSTTNANLLNLIRGNVTWTFTSSATGNFTRAAESAQTDDFFEGPFGEVPANATFNRADGTLGYTTNPAAGGITPLVMSSSINNAMIFGVNKSERIIYHGDANLFLNGQLNNDNGIVTNDLDRLMANVWAWIVEQLIYGDD